MRELLEGALGEEVEVDVSSISPIYSTGIETDLSFIRRRMRPSKGSDRTFSSCLIRCVSLISSLPRRPHELM